jgi:hypothetical protein
MEVGMNPQLLAARHATTGKPDDAMRSEIRQAALSHMLGVVARARVESQPFPHFIVEGFFPDELYREILAALPDARLYEEFGYEKHATDGASNRGRFVLSSQNLDHLLGRQRSLWLGVRDALGAPELKDAVFGRLSQGLAYRFGIPAEAAAAVPAYPRPELFRETTGYKIKPHPDTRRKLVTMQIALPPDDRQREIGTQFYRRSYNPLAMFREPRGFDECKRAPFLPNVAYAFVVINSLWLKSWHGRTTLPGDVGVRNTILNIWYAQAKDGSAELVERYYRAG